MTQIRRGIVLEARASGAGRTDLIVEIAGARERAIAYDALTGPVRTGDVVVLNTTAVALGLGTGGVHFVMAVEGREQPGPPAGHAMKLRYTPAQTAVDAIEQTHTDLLDEVGSLDGIPVIAAGLHSALAPAVLAARAVDPSLRIAYVMTDAAALVMAFSNTVPALRAAGLLDATITTGQATGGEIEAISLFGALAAAKAVAHAEVVVVSMGPGNLGSGSRWGHASIEVAGVVNAAAAMGATPIVVPRISFADTRERHRGLSHHTVTALTLMLARAHVTVPLLTAEKAAEVGERLAALETDHEIVPVDLGPAEAALKASPVPLLSMGRTYEDDPDLFRAAAAGGVHAANIARARR